MSTDGIKIIDGDTAHDTYWGIMDLYDSGADFSVIENNYPLIQIEFYDDFEHEIYVTAYGLANWEIGQMTPEKLNYIKTIIDKGVGVKEWTKNDEKYGKARQKELDKFLSKISRNNDKVRKRKKFRKITNFYFQEDDLLTFKHTDGNYRAVICATIEQYRGQCNYILIPTTYNSNKKPTTEELSGNEILGREIGSGYDQKATMEKQPGIERIWKLVGGNCNFFFGLVKLAVDHNDLITFKDNLEKVGTLKIIEGLKQTGTFGYIDSFDELKQIFNDLENYIKIFQFKKYPVTTLCDI